MVGNYKSASKYQNESPEDDFLLSISVLKEEKETLLKRKKFGLAEIIFFFAFV